MPLDEISHTFVAIKICQNVKVHQHSHFLMLFIIAPVSLWNILQLVWQRATKFYVNLWLAPFTLYCDVMFPYASFHPHLSLKLTLLKARAFHIISYVFLFCVKFLFLKFSITIAVKPEQVFPRCCYNSFFVYRNFDFSVECYDFYDADELVFVRTLSVCSKLPVGRLYRLLFNSSCCWDYGFCLVCSSEFFLR